MAKYVNPLDPPYVPPADADTDTAANQSPSPAPSESVSASVSTPDSSPSPSSSSTVAIPSDDDISTMADLLSALSPADIDRLRLASSANPDLSLMLAVSNGDSNIKRLPDGSIQATIVLSPDVVEPLTVWAESSGMTLGQEIQEIAEISISSYLAMDWGAMQTQPAVAPVAAAAAVSPVVVPPAVTK